MVSTDTKNNSQDADKVEVAGMSGDSEVSIEISSSSYKSIWGGNKVLVLKSTVDQMRGWVGLTESNDNPSIIGVGKLTDLVHIVAVLSISDDSEPNSLKMKGEKTKEIVNMQSLDRVAKNEIAAIELLLKERYDGDDVVLIERLSAHVQRGVDLLAGAIQKLELNDEITILDLLQVLEPSIFNAPIGITPAQNTLDEFI